MIYESTIEYRTEHNFTHTKKVNFDKLGTVNVHMHVYIGLNFKAIHLKRKFMAEIRVKQPQ